MMQENIRNIRSNLTKLEFALMPDSIEQEPNPDDISQIVASIENEIDCFRLKFFGLSATEIANATF